MTLIHSLYKRLTVWAISLLGFFVCTTVWAGALQSTTTYRERIALPPDAVFEAELQDISRTDVQAAVLSRTRLKPGGQRPFRFEFTYDYGAVHRGGRYTVRATIIHKDRLLFTTDGFSPCLTGAPYDGICCQWRQEEQMAARSRSREARAYHARHETHGAISRIDMGRREGAVRRHHVIFGLGRKV